MDKALSLKERLAELATLGAPQLRAEWASLFGNPAPRRVSRDILLRGIAYRLQEKVYGGLKPATIKRLKRLASGVQDGGRPAPAPAASLRPGTRLLREWNGRTETVDVLQDGFEWRGTRYRSLSAIARAITGVQWSGPKFFGLLDRPRADADGPAPTRRK
jgi:Protein of unknown function (DUF2924)